MDQVGLASVHEQADSGIPPVDPLPREMRGGVVASPEESVLTMDLLK